MTRTQAVLGLVDGAELITKLANMAANQESIGLRHPLASSAEAMRFLEAISAAVMLLEKEEPRAVAQPQP